MKKWTPLALVVAICLSSCKIADQPNIQDNGVIQEGAVQGTVEQGAVQGKIEFQQGAVRSDITGKIDVQPNAIQGTMTVAPATTLAPRTEISVAPGAFTTQPETVKITVDKDALHTEWRPEVAMTVQPGAVIVNLNFGELGGMLAFLLACMAFTLVLAMIYSCKRGPTT